MKTKKDPVVRANELFANTEEDPNTLHEVHVSDCDAVKKEVCSTLSHRRVGRKDIFEVNLERAISLIDFAAEKYPVYVKSQEENEQQSGRSDEPIRTIKLIVFVFSVVLVVLFFLLLISSSP